MKDKLPRVWREQTLFHPKFTSGRDELTLRGILTFEGDSPNGTPSYELVFFGDCEDEDGEIVRRRKHYNISREVAESIVQAMDRLERFAGDRPPTVARERFQELPSGFVVSLKRTPEITCFVFQHPGDGWRFETEQRTDLIRAFVDVLG